MKPPIKSTAIIRFNCEHKRLEMDDDKEWCVDCGQITTTFTEEYPEGFFD